MAKMSACFEDFQKDKKKRLPDQISDAHLELMIKMLRELDPMSTGSLDGLDYNIIKKTVRQVSPLRYRHSETKASR